MRRIWVLILMVSLALAGCGGGNDTLIDVGVTAAPNVQDSTGSYTVNVTGEVNFSANAVAANRTADGRIILSFYFNSRDNAVIIGIPPNLAAVGSIVVEDADLPSARRANVTIGFAGDTIYSFTRNASGTITISALDETAVRGEFNVMVEDSSGRSAAASGTFDVTFRVYTGG